VNLWQKSREVEQKSEKEKKKKKKVIISKNESYGLFKTQYSSNIIYQQDKRNNE
jgi:DUF2075 family protein